MTLMTLIETSNAYKIAVMFLINLSILFIYHACWIKPLERKHQILMKEELELKNRFEHKQRLASKLKGTRQTIDQLKQQITFLLKRLAPNETLPTLMERMFKLAKKNTLVIQLFAPQPEIKHDVYIELPVILVMKGTYHSLLQFLSQINQQPYLINFDDIKMHGSDKGSNELLIKIKFKIHRSCKT